MKSMKNSASAKFGKDGWTVILYCMFMFFFYVGMVNDGTNALAPEVANRVGCELGDVLHLNGLAGMVGVLGFIVVGQINRKLGPRVTSSIFTALSGVAYIVCGNATMKSVYFIAMCIVVTSIMSAGYISGGTLVANWFPKKKGLVMGFTTMGHNFASAFYVAILTGLIALWGITGGTIAIGVAAILLGILGYIFVRDTPSERNMYPDNVTKEVYESEYYTEEDTSCESEWTTSKLLKTRELWLAAITTGFFQICSVGVMSQLVTRNIRDFGMGKPKALMIMTMIALIGVFGSWLIGVIDDAIGTRKTMMFFGLWYAIALACNFMARDTGILFYISIVMIGMGIGGSANFTTSLPTAIFGRQGFDKVNSVIFPIQGFITSWCFIINGIVTNVIGNLRIAYMIFAIVALVNILLVSIVDEHKYNKDFMVSDSNE